MTWKVKVGVDCHGNVLIGHEAVNQSLAAGELEILDYKYPSQFGYMISAHDNLLNWYLTTRTDAKKMRLTPYMDASGYYFHGLL